MPEKKENSRLYIQTGLIKKELESNDKEVMSYISFVQEKEMIENCAFEKCKGLQGLYFEGTPEEWQSVVCEYWWEKDATKQSVEYIYEQ